MNQDALSTRKQESGFSLVEIVLALGIVSFSLVALIGLMAVSLESGQASREDALSSAMTFQVNRQLRSCLFSKLAENATNGTTASFYFDHEGNGLPAAAGAVYECKAQLEEHVDYKVGAEPYLLKVKIDINLVATGTLSRLKSAHMAIARYE